MKLIFCSLMLSSFVLNLASAQTFTGSSRGSTGKILYAAIDAKVGYSSEASEDKSSIKSRKLASYAGDINLGFRSYFNTIFAVNGEYALIKQLTDPSEVSNSNTQGKMFSISPLFGFEFGPFSILAKFPKALSSEYTLDKKNSSNQEVKFTDAKVLGVQMNLMISPYSFLGLQYQKYTFEKMKSGPTETTLSTDNKFNLSTLSFLYGYSY